MGIPREDPTLREELHVFDMPRLGDPIGTNDPDDVGDGESVGSAQWSKRTPTEHLMTSVNNIFGVIEDLGVAAAAPFYGIRAGFEQAEASREDGDSALGAAAKGAVVGTVIGVGGIFTGLYYAVGDALQAGAGAVSALISPLFGGRG
jgi:hypothetical protein